MTRYFITATGTAIGKTYVTCSLIGALRRRGVAVEAVKPVISGFVAAEAEASDTGMILLALGRPIGAQTVAQVSPWRFAAALSPDMAAAREGRVVALDAVRAFCDETMRGDRVVLIEGVGGVMSPIGRDFTNLDLIASLDARVVLVAGTYLGTISHTLTACEALAARGRKPWAIVLSESDDSPVTPDETARSIGRFVDAPVHVLTRHSELAADFAERILA